MSNGAKSASSSLPVVVHDKFPTNTFVNVLMNITSLEGIGVRGLLFERLHDDGFCICLCVCDALARTRGTLWMLNLKSQQKIELGSTKNDAPGHAWIMPFFEAQFQKCPHQVLGASATQRKEP